MTILDDSAGAGGRIYNGFQEWQNNINDHVENTSSTGLNAQRKRWTVSQLDVDGTTILKHMILNGCWPVSVGGIELSAGKRDSLVTFDVRMRYDYLEYEPGAGTAPPLGGD